MDYKTIAVIALAFVVFAVIVGVRWSFGEKYQVTLTDLLLVVTPILIWLVVTGKLGEATLGWKDGLTIKAAANQLLRASPISVQPLNTALLVVIIFYAITVSNYPTRALLGTSLSLSSREFKH
jgi:hypothetical protein